MRKEKLSVVERKVFLFVSRPKLEPGLKLLSEETIGDGVRNDPVHASAGSRLLLLGRLLRSRLLGRLLSCFLLSHGALPPFLSAECKARQNRSQRFFLAANSFFDIYVPHAAQGGARGGRGCGQTARSIGSLP